MNLILSPPAGTIQTAGPYLIGFEFTAGINPPNLYPPSPPTHSTFKDAVNSTGTNFFSTVPVSVKSIRFYKDALDTATSRTVGLWDITTSTLLSQATSSAEPASGWIEVPLPSPVVLTPNHPYQAGMFSPTGYYEYSYHYFDNQRVHGALTGYQAGAAPVITVNSAYSYGAAFQLARTQCPNNGAFFVDVVLQPVPGNDLLVNALGRWIIAGSVVGQVHKIYVLDVNGNVLGQVSVNTTGQPTGAYVFGSLASPIRLTGGTNYWCVCEEFNAGDGWYFTQLNDYNSGATVITSGFVTGLTPAVPTLKTADQVYGPTNFSYTIPPPWVQVADTSTVVALRFEIGLHVPLQVADTSTVIALGLEVARDFPVVIADTSSVVSLGFHQLVPLHFPTAIADTSTVLSLGFEVIHRFVLNIADISRVRLDFYNDLYEQPVPPYAGQDQPGIKIEVPATIAYKYIDWEEGPWVMIPYAQLYPPAPEPELVLRGRDMVHQEWLKLHKPPKNRPHRMGDRSRGPESVLPPPVRQQPIKRKPVLPPRPGRIRERGVPHL